MVFSNPIPFRDLSIIHCNNDDLITIWLCYCWLENIQIHSAQKLKINPIDHQMIKDPGVQLIYPVIATLSKEDIFKQALIRMLNVLQLRA